MKNYNDTIIIGGGISGITCAIHLKLHGIDSIVFEKNKIGGMLNYAYSVYNIPFFNIPLSGNSICLRLKRSVKNRGIKINKQNVKQIKIHNEYFQVIANKIYTCKYLIIATGTLPKYIEFNHNSIVYAPNKRKMKNRDIIIYGGGDIAFDFALSVNEYANVKIITRGEVKANKRLIKMIEHKNIHVSQNRKLKNVIYENKKLKLLFKDKIENCDYMLVAIGRESNTGILNGIEKGDNLFIIGDAVKRQEKYIAHAMSDAISVAEHIKRSINESRIIK